MNIHKKLMQLACSLFLTLASFEAFAADAGDFVTLAGSTRGSTYQALSILHALAHKSSDTMDDDMKATGPCSDVGLMTKQLGKAFCGELKNRNGCDVACGPADDAVTVCGEVKKLCDGECNSPQIPSKLVWACKQGCKLFSEDSCGKLCECEKDLCKKKCAG